MSGDAFTRRTQSATLLLLLGLGLSLRCYHVGYDAITHDESFTWRVSERPMGAMVHQVALDTHPLLHFLALKAILQTFGGSLLAMRSISIVAGVATIWVTYRLTSLIIRSVRSPGEEGIDPGWAGLVAASYVALHPLHVELSRTARMYALAAFLSALSAWLMLSASGLRRPWRWLIAYAVAAVALMHTHYYGVFVVAAQLGYAFGAALGTRENRGERLAEWAATSSLVFVLYAPWLPTFLEQASRVREGFWIPPATLQSLAELLTTFVSGDKSIDSGQAVFALLSVAAMGFAASRSGWSRGWFLPIQAAAPWAFAMLVSTLGRRPVLQERYLLLATPAFAAWFGLALGSLRGGNMRILLAVNLLLPTSLALIPLIRALPAAETPLFDAIAYLKANVRDGDVILVPQPATVNVLRYYASRAGLMSLDIRCVMKPLDLAKPGQANHLSSLEPGEILPESGLAGLQAGRAWVFNGAYDLHLFGWDRVDLKNFGPARGVFVSGIQLIGYAKLPPSAGKTLASAKSIPDRGPRHEPRVENP